MSAQQISNITKAINRLDAAVESATSSLGTVLQGGQALTDRMLSYKEVVRRQRILLEMFSKATLYGEVQEAARLIRLVHDASIMIKLDAHHILSSLRDLKAMQSSVTF